MRFWDSSALVPLLVEEPSSGARRSLHESDPVIVVWWGSLVECESALASFRRRPGNDSAPVQAAVAGLEDLAQNWIEVPPEDQIRSRARRLLRVHPLRAADALQLAAALVAAAEEPADLELVCGDARLSAAARQEGFVVR